MDWNTYVPVGLKADKSTVLRDMAHATDNIEEEKFLHELADELEELRELEEEPYTLEVSEALEMMLEYDEHQKMAIIETMNKRLEHPIPSPKQVLNKVMWYYKHPVSKLREFCKDLHLPSSGNKQELVELLTDKWLLERFELEE